MAAVNLRHPGPVKENEGLFLKGPLTLSSALPFLPFFSFPLEASGVLPCLLWSAFTCSQPVWKVYENILKEMRTQQNNLYVTPDTLE